METRNCWKCLHLFIIKTKHKMTALAQFETKIEQRMKAAGMPVERIRQELSFANQRVSADKNLQECTPASLAAAVVNIANVGLTLNPVAKEAAIVYRWNGKTRAKEAQLMPMYPGLVKLLTNAGSVRSIVSNVVYENDVFELDIADNLKPVKHKPCLIRAKRGTKIGAYSLATLADGTRQAEWMDIEDLHGIRARSDSYKYYLKEGKDCPWTTDEDEMMRKTVLRRLTKWLPRSGVENKYQEAIDTAIDLDNRDYGATYKQTGYIDSLLNSANISTEKFQEIERTMYDMTFEEAQATIEFLQQNQVEERDPRKQFKARANAK